MANINRVRIGLSNWPGGPGVSTVYCLDPEAFLPLLRAWLQNSAGFFPEDVLVQVEGVGDVIDSTTGELTGTWTAAVPDAVTGAHTGVYASPTGVCVNWLTAGVLNGHRLRGRTFLVPFGSSTFDLTGSIDATVLAALRESAASFVTAAAANFVIWHRPIPSGEPNGPRAGGHDIVVASAVNDKVAILRSRRD